MDTKQIFEFVSLLAKDALIDEVECTPKPGLVDRNNSGSHKDMNINTFKNSAKAIQTYLYKFVEFGYNSVDMPETEVFSLARAIGIDAEKAMLNATRGVNTHKGAIFSIGLVCLAVGGLLGQKKQINIDNICSTVSAYTYGICENDYRFENSRKKLSNGEKIYKKYRVKGPRGEAEEGFPTVRNVSYPKLKEYISSGLSQNESLVRTLIYIMSVVDDTNIINRGGLDGAVFVKARAGELYNQSIDSIVSFDNEMIEKNLSPGGCADLLALTWFIYLLEQKLPQNFSR